MTRSPARLVQALTLSALLPFGGAALAQDATVIEIATMQLKAGVTIADFAPLDKAVEDQHVSQQPGFVSRSSAATEDGKWLVVVHWESQDAAQASMDSFANAPAAAPFMEMIDLSTMAMTRYDLVR